MKPFSALWRLCAILFEALATFFAKGTAQLVAMARGPAPPAQAAEKPAGSGQTLPAPCPYCGGGGKAPIAIADTCDCGKPWCSGFAVRGGAGRACPVCSGTLVVPRAVRRAMAGDDPIEPLRLYARAGRWN